MRLLDKPKDIFSGGNQILQTIETIEPSLIKLEDVGKILHLLDDIPIVAVTCEDVDEVLDQFAEATMHGENVAELMPLIYQHIMKCLCCQPKYQALLRVLQAVRA